MDNEVKMIRSLTPLLCVTFTIAAGNNKSKDIPPSTYDQTCNAVVTQNFLIFNNFYNGGSFKDHLKITDPIRTATGCTFCSHD